MTNRFFWAAAVVCGALACSSGAPPAFTNDAATDIAPGDVTCTADLAACAGACVSLRDSPSHCGACGNACATGQMCIAGQCASACPGAQTRCGSLCASLDTDRQNCGACGTACPTGRVCSQGRCTVTCGAMYARCEDPAAGDAGVDGGTRVVGPYCTDTRSDERNCGACGMPCALGSLCDNGTCVARCPASQTMCGAQCVTLSNDNANCGACANACTGRARCADGMCVTTACAAGTTLCGAACADLQFDSRNCGACGTVCAAPSFCRMGTCTTECRTGSTMCGAVCVDRMTDRLNCGMCGNACPTGQVCAAGACSMVCPAGTTVCAGRCVDLSSDRVNCGRCATACTGSQLCNGGACAPSCAPEQTNCDGVCVNTQVDANHCGACGVACGPGYACGGGFCRPLVGTDVIGCATPSLMCGAVCTDVRNDNANCGACGRPCAADRVCAAAMCSAPCFSGQIRCNGVCTDVRGDRTNCGACGTVCTAPLVCGGGRCVSDPTFRVAALTATNCRTQEHDSLTGDDHGGIGITSTRLFYTADGVTTGMATGRFSAADLSAGTAIATLEGMSGDLLNENLYLLQNALAQGPETATGGGGTFLATQLGVVNGDTGAPTGAVVRLSTPIIMGTNFGLFAGYGRMLIHTGTGTGVTSQWFSVQLPSGTVTALAVAAPPTHTLCETSGYWGIAEYFGGDYYAVYVQSSTSIVRYRVRDAMVTPVATFTNLSDTCSITLSPSRNRWYFHHEGSSQFGTGNEIVGYCDARFENP